MPDAEIEQRIVGKGAKGRRRELSTFVWSPGAGSPVLSSAKYS